MELKMKKLIFTIAVLISNTSFSQHYNVGSVPMIPMITPTPMIIPTYNVGSVPMIMPMPTHSTMLQTNFDTPQQPSADFTKIQVPSMPQPVYEDPRKYNTPIIDLNQGNGSMFIHSPNGGSIICQKFGTFTNCY